MALKGTERFQTVNSFMYPHTYQNSMAQEESKAQAVLTAYRVKYNGKVLFEVVAESVKRAQRLVAHRLDTLVGSRYNHDDCTLTPVGTVSTK